VQAVIADWRTAPLDVRLRAALGFLEKLTLHPAEVQPVDVALLRAAGITDDAIEDVIYVCFIFCTMDRLADAFDFDLPSTYNNRWNALVANIVGYRLLSLFGE
jgi:alkylhydroperoxidase family enzyme